MRSLSTWRDFPPELCRHALYSLATDGPITSSQNELRGDAEEEEGAVVFQLCLAALALDGAITISKPDADLVTLTITPKGRLILAQLDTELQRSSAKH